MNKYRVIWYDDTSLIQFLYMGTPICIMTHPDFQSLPLVRSQWSINHHSSEGFYPIYSRTLSFITEAWNQDYMKDYKYYYEEFNSSGEIKQLVFDLVDQLNKEPIRIFNRFENLLE